MLRVKTKKLMLPVVSIAAAGSTQSDATAMGDDAFVTVSAADGTKGIKLPVPSDNCRVCSVYNEHATSRLKVYPHSTGDINDGTTDAALLIDGKTYVLFHAQDATTWAALEVNRITSPTLVTPLLDDGDAGLTLTSANQTSATATATFPDIGDAADEVVMKDTTQTLTGKTLTSPTLTTPAIGAATGASLAVTGAVTSSGATAGVGYATGAGGAVTQITSSSTAVTLNKVTGQITTVALTTAAAAEERFTVTNSAVAATDAIVLGTTYDGAGTPMLSVQKIAAGAFDVVITNVHAANALNAAMVINFTVIKGVAA